MVTRPGVRTRATLHRLIVLPARVAADPTAASCGTPPPGATGRSTAARPDAAARRARQRRIKVQIAQLGRIGELGYIALDAAKELAELQAREGIAPMIQALGAKRHGRNPRVH